MERCVAVGRGMGLKRRCFIMETLEEFRCMTVEQIADLCFHTLKPDVRKTKARKYLLELYKDKKLSRAKAIDFKGQFFYWLQDKRHRSWEQYLWVNEVFRLFPVKNKRLKHEVKFGDLRMDGIIVTSDKYAVAIEIDSTDSHAFDKIRLYNFEAIKGNRVNLVLIITHRVQTVEKHIEKENHQKVNFKVLSFGDIEGVKKLCPSSALAVT